ncbi:TadE family type IV pilus minor pilin [Saccharomonospora sp. NB11]|jgi:Flp pilus assembly protein TadG|uniref:TadE family type IV pilus minor pilin n=1 Tax=Saccharomonospora sp. NB11 TaxID=1642298 RepID=UPI0018D1E349|nr:TadE family type IV pilus minor pilin [Saccharomonospora sp. NB11]
MHDRPHGGVRYRDRGAVTVEAAIAVCALVAVFGLVLAGVATVVDHLRCMDAAAQAARVLARGTPEAVARQVVEATAPDGVAMTVDRTAEYVIVRVRASAAGGLVPGLVVQGEAQAMIEPGAQEPGAGEAVHAPP